MRNIKIIIDGEEFLNIDATPETTEKSYMSFIKEWQNCLFAEVAKKDNEEAGKILAAMDAKKKLEAVP